MTEQQLIDQWLKKNKPTKCRTSNKPHKCKPATVKHTIVHTSSECIVVCSLKPIISKASDCKSVHIGTTIKAEIEQFQSEYKQCRADTVNAMLLAFKD